MAGDAIARARQIFVPIRRRCGGRRSLLRLRKRCRAEHEKHGGKNFRPVHVIRPMIFVISLIAARPAREAEPRAEAFAEMPTAFAVLTSVIRSGGAR